MTRARYGLAAAHLAGNALLLLLGYYWLGLGESDALHLVYSGFVLLLFVCGVIWLHASALVLFRNELSFTRSVLSALRNLPPLLLLTVIIVAIYVLLLLADGSFGHTAFVIGSYSTMTIRRPVEPDKVLKVFHFFIWLLRWFAVPVVFLPLASEVASLGWAGFDRRSLQKSAKPLFWIKAGIILVAAVHLPVHLFTWVPAMPNFSLEVLSVAGRLGLAYLLFTAGLLALEYVTSAGKPLVTQPETVASP